MNKWPYQERRGEHFESFSARIDSHQQLSFNFKIVRGTLTCFHQGTETPSEVKLHSCSIMEHLPSQYL